MNTTNPKIIWTIGHSTRTAEYFIDMLQSFCIDVLVDIRTYPGSKRYPHFNKEYLENILPGNKVKYVHFESLGGRRKPNPDSKNTTWKNAGFRGYADYMETEEFKNAMHELEAVALQQRTAFMCSEAVWWRCHRSLVSDYLKANGWTVYHIMDIAKATEHTFTKPAKIVDRKLSYEEKKLF